MSASTISGKEARSGAIGQPGRAFVAALLLGIALVVPVVLVNQPGPTGPAAGSRAAAGPGAALYEHTIRENRAVGRPANPVHNALFEHTIRENGE